MQETHAIKNGSCDGAHEAACGRVAARFRERWLRIYAGRKLRGDPIFRVAFELFGDSDQPLVDLGCGVGLLSFYLRERNFRPPISGLDCDGRKVKRALAVAGGAYDDLEFIEGDIGEEVAARGNIVLFDILHYLSPEKQARVLNRLAEQIPPGGTIIIRDCPREQNMRYWLTNLAERFAQATSWNISVLLHFPTREQILGPFDRARFSRTVRPLWGRTPFNNHLFILRRLR